MAKGKKKADSDPLCSSEESHRCDLMDPDVFKLTLIEAFRDASVAEAIGAAVKRQVDTIADEVVKRLDARMKSFQAQLEAKDERIVALESDVTKLKNLLDDQEQYSRRESLRFSGIAESINGEDTDQLVLDLVNKEMKLVPPLERDDIARSHRSGDKDKAQDGRRAILARFATYRIRDRVIRARRNLKTYNIKAKREDRPRVFINEDLTKQRMDILYQARQFKKQDKIKDTWSWDGIIRIQARNNRVHAITKMANLTKLMDDLAKSEGEHQEDESTPGDQ